MNENTPQTPLWAGLAAVAAMAADPMEEHASTTHDLLLSISEDLVALAQKHVPTSETVVEFCSAVSMALGMLCAGWARDEVIRLSLVDLCRKQIRDTAFSEEGARAADLLEPA